MADWRPPTRFDTYIELLIPALKTYHGAASKVWPKKGLPVMCSFRTFGGTEKTVNGVYSIEKTATVETWFRPDITSDCRIRLGNAEYEILGEPENIQQRSQYLRLKVRSIGGGA